MSSPDPDDRVDSGLPEDLRPWLEDLRTLQEPVPELDVVLARAAFETRDLDAELVALWDSREHVGPHLRAAAPESDEWYLHLLQPPVETVVTVTRVGDRRRLDGAVTAGSVTVRLELEQPTGRVAVELDDLGRFTAEVVGGPLRLRCAVDGRVVVSDWVTL